MNEKRSAISNIDLKSALSKVVSSGRYHASYGNLFPNDASILIMFYLLATKKKDKDSKFAELEEAVTFNTVSTVMSSLTATKMENTPQSPPPGPDIEPVGKKKRES